MSRRPCREVAGSGERGRAKFHGVAAWYSEQSGNIILEHAFARFLVLVRTKGRPITSTTKDSHIYPENLVEIVKDDTTHFQGVSGEPQRERLLEHWLASDFATCIRAGMGRGGKPANTASASCSHPKASRTSIASSSTWSALRSPSNSKARTPK